MKDTIRLSRRNRERLSFFDDDANRAIERVLDAHDQLKIKDYTVEQFKPLLQNATCTGGPAATMSFTTASSLAAGGPVAQAPTISSMPRSEFWKMMETTIGTKLQEVAGRGY